MNASADKPPLLPSSASAPTPSQALRRLFLLLFLRGRGARGLNQKKAPKSISEKLLVTLLVYLVIGCLFSFSMMRQPVFALAVYLHAMTFAFLGMFVASSAGEILFNKEEADILIHRPVDSRTMLWSKIRVLVEVSLWVAGAFNLAGLFAGLGSSDGSWRFPIAHAISTILEALFCTGCVVLVYQLCLRWFGRERLEGLMTTTQVLVSVAAVLSSQLLPRIVFRFGRVLTASESSWWIGLLPPAWFAGFDDAFAGSAAPMPGPAAICHGARRAVLCFLTLPILIALAAIIFLVNGFHSECFLFLPGIVVLPVYSLLPGLIGKAVPLSSPIEEAKSARRGPIMYVVMLVSMGLSGLALFAWSQGWFWQFLLAEVIVVFGLYIWMRIALEKIRWKSAE